MIRRLELPYPPSANRYWRKTKTGRIYVSEDAKAFKSAVAELCHGMKPVTGDVAVEVRVFRPRKSGDLDNTLKVTLDALRGFAFVDDKQVVKITAYRADDKIRPRAEVLISEVEPAEALKQTLFEKTGYSFGRGPQPAVYR